MIDLFWLTEVQMARLRSLFPKIHGKSRVGVRHVPGGMIFANRTASGLK